MKNENNIYQKLHDCKSEIGKIAKDKKNPFFKSNYLSLNGLLDAVEPVLDKHGLLLLQPIRLGLVSTQIIDIESGECENSDIALGNITDPQKLGSAITYFRRYTLQSLLGLQAEDDDGNLASKPDIERKPNLEADNFQKTLKAKPEQIKAVLERFRMSPDQRKVLEQLIK